METIALNRRKQTKLDNRVTKIKGQLRNGLKLREDVKKAKKGKKKASEDRGVIYIGHIPHGFYEDEIRAYCSQFGTITRVRVARSRRTGRSKGYAFVEFLHADVAKIVADTINNYLMFNRLLSCQYIPLEKRHSRMFANSITADTYPALLNRQKNTEAKNKPKEKRKDVEAKQKALRKIEEFRSFFEDRGIEFNFKVNNPSCDLPQVQEEEPVLEIDESDDEVEFNSPANVRKIFKRSTKPKPLQLKRAPKRKDPQLPNGLKAKRNKGH